MTFINTFMSLLLNCSDLSSVNSDLFSKVSGVVSGVPYHVLLLAGQSSEADWCILSQLLSVEVGECPMDRIGWLCLIG